MKKYFGILNNEKVENLEVEELFKFYIDNELFYISHLYSIDNQEIGNPQIELKPTQIVINSLCDYSKELLSRKIDSPFLLFFNEFNESIYGLDIAAGQQLALKRFNELYKKIKVLKASFLKREKDSNGVEQVQSMNRFDFLKGRQNAQKKELATTENVLEFLNGNDTHFNSQKFIDNPNTKQFIEFETNLKMLVSLNSNYKFEDDFHFSDLGILKNIFEKYNDTFKLFEVFLYTHKKIQCFTSTKPAYIASLYIALFEMGFIPNSKKDFIKYVNLEHQMELTKLKNYKPTENRNHDLRVQKFKEDLQEYSKKI